MCLRRVLSRSAAKIFKDLLRVQKQMHSSIQLILEVAASVLSASGSNSAPCLSSQAILASLCKPMQAYASLCEPPRRVKTSKTQLKHRRATPCLKHSSSMLHAAVSSSTWRRPWTRARTPCAQCRNWLRASTCHVLISNC